MQQETGIIGNRRHMLSLERYWQNMIDREMVEEENKDEKYGMRIAAVVCMVIMCISLFPQMGQAAKKKESCKTLCGYALKATGGAKKLKYSSAAALDFGALTHSVRSQVKTIQYVCDSKEAYSLCVMEAKNGKGAKKLYNALKKYQKANSKSDYLSDYSKTEQKVFKNAIYGKKGTFVWYIAMSPSKAVNKKDRRH